MRAQQRKAEAPPPGHSLSEIARRLEVCVELARALDAGQRYVWWGDSPHFAPIATDEERQYAIEYLASSIGAAREALLGPDAPPYID